MPAVSPATGKPVRAGPLWAGVGAYTLWGLVPLYFKLVEAARADEIIAHRVVWSVGFLLLALAPSISFCLAVFLFREPFTLNHAVAFGAIWTALAIYSAAGWYRMRQLRLTG